MPRPGWNEIRQMAAEAGAAHPDLVAAQWALESGWGESPSGRNNYFGIKAGPGEPGSSKKTWEVLNGRNVTVTDSFRDFETPQQGVQYLVDRWYNDFEGYRGVNRARSPEEAADLLRAEGYATDPSYSAKLKQLLAKHGGGKGAPPPRAVRPSAAGAGPGVPAADAPTPSGPSAEENFALQMSQQLLEQAQKQTVSLLTPAALPAPLAAMPQPAAPIGAQGLLPALQPAADGARRFAGEALVGAMPQRRRPTLSQLAGLEPLLQ
jgi:hypothetical protein